VVGRSELNLNIRMGHDRPQVNLLVEHCFNHPVAENSEIPNKDLVAVQLDIDANIDANGSVY